MSPLNSNLELAAPGSDFAPVVGGYITISDGENSGTIVAQIKEDSVPEVDEVFTVQITQLQLLTSLTTNFQPVLGMGFFCVYTIRFFFKKNVSTFNTKIYVSLKLLFSLKMTASEGTIAEIIINANDGTQGEVIFAPQSVS